MEKRLWPKTSLLLWPRAQLLPSLSAQDMTGSHTIEHIKTSGSTQRPHEISPSSQKQNKNRNFSFVSISSVLLRSLPSTPQPAMAAALRSSSAAAVHRLLRVSPAALSTLSAASRPAAPAVTPFSRLIAAISYGNSAFSWNFRRLFCSNEKHLPSISDPEIESAFKDVMAATWSEFPGSLVEEAKKAVSKATDDKAGQEVLENVFCAVEACEEFSGMLVTLRMSLDDLCGLTGENVGPLPGYIEDAVKSAYNRYMTYLESFGPEEHYLRKKVETELGTKMIHQKMRCSGIGSEWGKITLIGTPGISGSYVELRA